MIFDHRQNTLDALGRATGNRQRILADPNLTDVGKAQRLARDVTPFITAAQQSAAWWLGDLDKQRQRALDALAQAQRDAAAAVNVDRRANHRRMIDDTVERGSWSEVQSGLDRAFAGGDVDAMAAWQSAMPVLRQRFDLPSGPSSDVHSGWVPYSSRLEHALPEPADVVEARAAVARAAVELDAARAELSNYDYVAGVRGEPQPFAQVLTPPAQSVTIGDPTNGGYFTMAGGQGAFG